MRVYGEPLIQHLTLDETEYFNKEWDHAARRVMSAALPRQEPPGFALGRACGRVAAGRRDRPLRLHDRAEADRCSGNFTKIPNGTGGLEDRMSVLWTKGVETGRLTPNEFVAVTSTNIAQILNIYPQKGAILPGSDADHRGLGPEAVEDDLGGQPEVDHRLQCLRGREGQRPGRATRCRAARWSGRTARTRSRSPAAASCIKRQPFPAVHKALSSGRNLPRRAPSRARPSTCRSACDSALARRRWPQTILLTGAAGLIGRAVHRMLASAATPSSRSTASAVRTSPLAI